MLYRLLFKALVYSNCYIFSYILSNSNSLSAHVYEVPYITTKITLRDRRNAASYNYHLHLHIIAHQLNVATFEPYYRNSYFIKA